MKLLFLTPTAVFSGGERITLDIAVAMRARGYEVFYCGLDGPVRDFVEKTGITFTALPKFTPWVVRKLVRELRPNIIHAMDFRASFYAALSGATFVAHLHNNPPWLRRFGPNSLAMLFMSLRAGKILAVSQSVLDEYVFAGAIRDKTLVLSNTVDIQAVLEQSQNGAVASMYDVGFIGRLVEQKQPLVFIDIITNMREYLPGVRALMLGEGELRSAVEKTIAERGLQESVTLAGFMPNPFPALASCKIIIMPSAWEGFGLTAVESMALGKPVLAAPVGGLKDIANERCGKLCATLAEYVNEAGRLLADTELYAQKSRAALKRAATYDCNAEYYDRVEAAYHSLLALPIRRRTT